MGKIKNEWQRYEAEKKKILHESKSSEEYERKIKQLIDRMKI
jgi:hypothetical protein